MGIIVLAVWLILFNLSMVIPELHAQAIMVGEAVVGVVAAILLLTGR